MEIFIYFFSETLSFFVGIILSFIIIISPHILPDVPQYAFGLGVTLFIFTSVFTLRAFFNDFKYFKKDRYHRKGTLFEWNSNKADIKYLKDLSLSEFKINLENILDGKTPKYIYSESYLIQNLALVLSLALLTIQTDNDSSDFKNKVNQLTNFLKRYSEKSIYEIDIETLNKIKKDFDSIIKFKFNL